VARPVGERELGAVGVQARAEVDAACVEQLRDVAVVAEAHDQLVQVVQHRGAGRQLGGVDVAVGPERRLVGRIAGAEVGDGRDPDVAPLVALADRMHRHQRRVRIDIVEQQARQRLVAQELVEARARGR